jgi:hypothetical protein
MSKRWVEDPIRFKLPDKRKRVSLVVAICLLVPAMLALVVRQGAARDWGVTLPAGWEERRLAGLMNCVDTTEEVWPAERCTITSPANHGLILLLGDSHASSASDGVAAAAKRLGMNFGVWAESGCPLLLDRSPYGHRSCPGWQEAALKAINVYQPEIVVIANRSSGYTPADGDKTWRVIATEDGSLPGTQAESLDAWEEGFEGLLDRLFTRHPTLHVLAFANVPEYPPFSDFPISLIRRSPSPPIVGRNEVDELRQVLQNEVDVISRFPRASLFDAAEVFCDENICRAGEDDVWWYMDGHHMNPIGSLILADSLSKKLSF